MLWYECVISGFLCELDVNCNLQGYYTSSGSSWLVLWQPNVTIFKSQEMGLIGCPEMSKVKNVVPWKGDWYTEWKKNPSA